MAQPKFRVSLSRHNGFPGGKRSMGQSIARSSHAVILAESNMHSLKHFWWQQTIAFWNALASAPASCLQRLDLIDNLQDASLHSVHNFFWSVSHCLCSVGYHLPTQVQSIPVIDTNTVIAGLDHQASLSWNNLSSNPRTAPTRNAKLCTWHNWFRPYKHLQPIFSFTCFWQAHEAFSTFQT